MRPPRLVCLGNITSDDIVLPDGTTKRRAGGGDALYAGFAARAIEPTAEIVAPIGHDLPETTLARLRERGFSLAGLPARARPTLHVAVEYLPDGERAWTFHHTEEDFLDLSPLPADIPDAYRSAEAFLILAMSLQATEALAGHLAPLPGLVALDPQQDYIPGNEDRVRAVLGRLDVFLPSAVEVRRLTGSTDWPAAARQLAALGPRLVVVKLGAAGCFIHDARSGRDLTVPAFPTAPVDTTGAGDSFSGAFMAALVGAPDDLEGAAHAGAAAASFTIADYGTAGIMAADPAAIRDRWLEDRKETR
ncbi:carbohydrate kinase family protein [Prosthecomicrobium pneumaticum]|uniref:Ribokinase n=1 Tax=Prosthecomicrobium pneumaticum TaxID=81895 RepID=A0A7W9L1Y3_9HYPH|nr:PfkB family carbohydrate kinase [Prosthecomicrobium pneumaticum]MBB5753067.1 ribokinase [Prosthecomicrobium pneumaticum]